LATSGSSIIVNFSYPGDLIKRMRSVARKSYLRGVLLDSTRVDWDLLLLSGGGLDLIDRMPGIVRSDLPTEQPTEPESWVDADVLRATIREVVDSFRELASLRDETVHRDMPILVHTYDYATQRNISRSFWGVRLGPWLYPVYRMLKVPM